MTPGTPRTFPEIPDQSTRACRRLPQGPLAYVTHAGGCSPARRLVGNAARELRTRRSKWSRTHEGPVEVLALLFLAFVVSAVCAFWCAKRAEDKGYNPVTWGVLGFLIPSSPSS